MSSGSQEKSNQQVKQRKKSTSNLNLNKKVQSKRNTKQTKQPQLKNNHSLVKEEMSKYVIWRRPVQTLYFFILELFDLIFYYFFKLLTYRKLVVTFALLSSLITSGFYIEGAHLPLLLYLRKRFLWCAYWVGLGVASSIGLGTGLHTFLLYLGPFIAQVTLAAYECNNLNFPEPPYPDDIICPNNSISIESTISILSIMSKVRLESFMWGAGTAIGELPPYFMARASALSGKDNHKNDESDNEELEEFEHLLQAEKDGSVKLNFLDKVRLTVFKIIKKVGFMGILLCASIPNPLFDLAGITCGHFLVRFWTFFGATLIGKAIIKMHIQKLFVIFLFSQHHLDNLFELSSNVPYVGTKLQPLFQEWLTGEKNKLHRTRGSDHGIHGSESILSWILGKIVLLMILFFVVSIVNSLAQQRYKRLNSHHLPVESTKKKVAND
ncbi:unnamed protein product [Brachionus calyciflorus]|uniref:Vacuole membrane protein 1 n=1 Tax=Brachionus calyciflorus TaxID=104777 RepID=A0A813MDG9_9BILA|nr:unnamed protein product [Brachionus calyciflorus]